MKDDVLTATHWHFYANSCKIKHLKTDNFIKSLIETTNQSSVWHVSSCKLSIINDQGNTHLAHSAEKHSTSAALLQLPQFNTYLKGEVQWGKTRVRLCSKGKLFPFILVMKDCTKAKYTCAYEWPQRYFH